MKISGRKFWLWRAVDQHGVVLEEILQSKRDKGAAKRFLLRLIKCHGLPKRILTNSAPMGRPNGTWRQALVIGRTRASTIAPRTATCHFESGNERCKASGHPADYSVSSQFIPLPEIVLPFHPDAAPP